MRANRSTIDKRAWLEVWDVHHRYAKNLRLYHNEWSRLRRLYIDIARDGDEAVASAREAIAARAAAACSSFWEWLDGNGMDAVRDSPLPELEGVPRAVLNTDVVHYCKTAKERRHYALTFHGGRILQQRTRVLEPINTSNGGWIFVLRDGVMYGARKKTTPPRFHHSSFFAGECVQTAGLLVAQKGKLKRLYPHSGHYRPTEEQLLLLLRYLQAVDIELDGVDVDMQHVLKVPRAHRHDGQKLRKMDTPHMWSAMDALHFLQAKERARHAGVLAAVQRLPAARGGKRAAIDGGIRAALAAQPPPAWAPEPISPSSAAPPGAFFGAVSEWLRPSGLGDSGVLCRGEGLARSATGGALLDAYDGSDDLATPSTDGSECCAQEGELAEECGAALNKLPSFGSTSSFTSQEGDAPPAPSGARRSPPCRGGSLRHKGMPTVPWGQLVGGGFAEGLLGRGSARRGEGSEPSAVGHWLQRERHPAAAKERGKAR